MWKPIQVSLVALCGVMSYLNSASLIMESQIDWLVVLGFFLFYPLSVLVGFGVLAGISSKKLRWQVPAWHRNPLRLAHPEQFFWLFAFCAIASGLGMMAWQIVSALPVSTDSVFPIAAGTGMWAGLRILTEVHGRQTRKASAEERDLQGAPRR